MKSALHSVIIVLEEETRTSAFVDQWIKPDHLPWRWPRYLAICLIMLIKLPVTINSNIFFSFNKEVKCYLIYRTHTFLAKVKLWRENQPRSSPPNLSDAGDWLFTSTFSLCLFALPVCRPKMEAPGKAAFDELIPNFKYNF